MKKLVFILCSFLVIGSTAALGQTKVREQKGLYFIEIEKGIDSIFFCKKNIKESEWTIFFYGISEEWASLNYVFSPDRDLFLDVSISEDGEHGFITSIWDLGVIDGNHYSFEIPKKEWRKFLRKNLKKKN